MSRKIISIVALALALAIGVAVWCLVPKNQAPAEPNQEAISVDTPNGEATPTPEPPKKENSLLALQEGLQKEIEDYDGDWAIYVESLSNGDSIEINNQKMVSASLIKLFVMGKVYEDIENGTLTEEQVKEDLELMITVSDNEATNRLVAMLGGGEYTDMKGEAFQKGLQQVNAYAQKMGFTDTEQQRDLKNSRPKPISEQNYTSVTDCGKLLSMLYHKTLVSEEADTDMLELLKKQTRTWKIPQGLPEGTVCANKTGELSNAENDVAIVFSPNGDYVICVISNNVSDTAQAQKNIIHLSEIVYQYFN